MPPVSTSRNIQALGNHIDQRKYVLDVDHDVADVVTFIVNKLVVILWAHRSGARLKLL